MAEDRKVDCPVALPQDIAVGDYSNAFRIVHDSGTEWFLDFLVFSESAQTAKVVSRVRVQEAFLEAIQGRMTATLQSIKEERGRVSPTLIVLDLDGEVN